MEFMVSVKFRSQDRAEIIARIKALRERGVEEALYISSDLSRVWIVMQGESQDQVQKN